MKFAPQKVKQMTLFSILFSIFFSCNKDTDLLLDSVLDEPEISIEEKNGTVETPSDEEGFVIRTFAFSPTNDAYLQDSQGHNKSIIRLQENFRTSYLMFDLRQVNGQITNAVLQFSVDSDEGDGSIGIHKGVSNEWTEENLTENNAPSFDVKLGEINKTYKVGSPEKVSLNSSKLQSELTTIILKHSDGNDLAFASKEHPENKGPKLIITYKAPVDSALIVQEEEEILQDDNTQDNQPKNNEQATAVSYFVTTSGKSTNDGKTESTAWDIVYAFDNAVAGDIVYIKAGNYGSKELVVDNSGTSENPIQFIGYTNTPGDLISTNGSTFNYGDQLDANKMPLLEGLAPNETGKGTAITAIESYIHIENFQITKFEFGLFARANYSTFKNIIVAKVGDFNPSHSYPSATSNSLLNYFGNGIVMSGNNSNLLNSIVLNSGAQAITFNNCNGVTAKNNKVYSDNNTNPTDYYFLIGENTLNSKFLNTIVYRVGSLEHSGHGIVFKGNGAITGNLVDGFEIINTVLESQFPYTKNNTFKNGIITKESNVNNNTPEVAGINLANGSGMNTFEDIVLTNCSIKFHDWKDGLAGDVSDASDSNILRRITINDSFSAIAFAYFQVENHASSADNNIFEDCNFNNINYLFEVDRANSNTILKNCSINGADNLQIERIPGGPSYSLDVTYQNCSWENINFTPPN